MTARSKGHHEIPKWLLKHFCWDKGKTLWMGSKDTREVKAVVLKDAFRRNYANTRIDYQSRGCGKPRRIKSDLDEKILGKFDDKADRGACRLIEFSRNWRDSGSDALLLSQDDMEICKSIIVAQARRTRESQDRSFLGKDNSEIYLAESLRLAELLKQPLPSRQELRRDPEVSRFFSDLSQNQRATFASANHPILADKETEFLAPLGLSVAVIGDTVSELIIGSHGVTIVETTEGNTTWLPIAPDVAISLSDKPRVLSIGAGPNEFVEQQNIAAFSASARVAGRSKAAILELIATMD